MPYGIGARFGVFRAFGGLLPLRFLVGGRLREGVVLLFGHARVLSRMPPPQTRLVEGAPFG
jgi:hypothetical protein